MRPCLIIAALATPQGVNARLLRPGNSTGHVLAIDHVDAAGLANATISFNADAPGHQLTAGAAAAREGVVTNPAIDAWHTEEKKKLKAECNDMLHKLWAEKRKKLKDLVDDAMAKVAKERARLGALKCKAEDELKELDAAKKKVEHKPSIDLKPTQDAIAAQKIKVAEIEKLMEEKKLCIDELNRAEADLKNISEKLAISRKKVATAEAAAKQARVDLANEKADIPVARQDLDEAKAELERVRKLQAEVATKLYYARKDLTEHDVGLDSDESAPVSAAALPVSAVAQPSQHQSSQPSGNAVFKSLARGPIGHGLAVVLAMACASYYC